MPAHPVHGHIIMRSPGTFRLEYQVLIGPVADSLSAEHGKRAPTLRGLRGEPWDLLTLLQEAIHHSLFQVPEYCFSTPTLLCRTGRGGRIAHASRLLDRWSGFCRSHIWTLEDLRALHNRGRFNRVYLLESRNLDKGPGLKNGVHQMPGQA